MPWAAPKPCNHIGCPALVHDGAGYCPAHQRQPRERPPDTRPTAARRGYDYRWQKIRARKLRADPLCERCKARGRVMPADMVHHRDGDPSNNAPGNLESLCNSCHAVVTADQKQAESR